MAEFMRTLNKQEAVLKSLTIYFAVDLLKLEVTANLNPL